MSIPSTAFGPQRSCPSGVTTIVATACATALVIASAGFGGVFAWKIGIEHSYLLACLTVLFAVALEGIKPLAISAAFLAQSFRHSFEASAC